MVWLIFLPAVIRYLLLLDYLFKYAVIQVANVQYATVHVVRLSLCTMHVLVKHFMFFLQLPVVNINLSDAQYSGAYQKFECFSLLSVKMKRVPVVGKQLYVFVV